MGHSLRILVIAVVLALVFAGSTLAESPAASSGAQLAGTAEQLEGRAATLGRSLLRQLHAARRDGRSDVCACLDDTLSQVNGLRRVLRASPRKSTLAASAERLADLRRRASACQTQRAPERTIVTAIIPAEPEGEPTVLDWNWDTRP